jgi:hypothetical protein
VAPGLAEEPLAHALKTTVPMATSINQTNQPSPLPEGNSAASIKPVARAVVWPSQTPTSPGNRRATGGEDPKL